MTPSKEISKIALSVSDNYGAPQASLSFCRGFHVEGEGTMSRVEGNIFFSNFFFLEKVIIDAINVILKNK